MNLSTKGTGGLTMRVTSHDQNRLAWAFVGPTLGWLVGRVRGRGDEMY